MEKTNRLDSFLLASSGVWVVTGLLTLVFGLVEVLVAVLVFVFSANLAFFVYVKISIVLALTILTFFNGLINVGQFRSGYLNTPDLRLTGLVLAALVVSILVIPLSQITRWVLVSPLIDGALLYIAYKIQARGG